MMAYIMLCAQLKIVNPVLTKNHFEVNALLIRFSLIVFAGKTSKKRLGDLTVTVMNGQQMQWILEHDYGADGEMAKAIKDRKKEMDRAQKVT